MRRQGPYAGDSSGSGGGGHHSYGGAADPMQHQQQNNISGSSGYYQGRHPDQPPIEEQGPQHHHNQWRWERDGGQNKFPRNPTSPNGQFNEGQGREASRSYYQGQRSDPRMPLEKQGVADSRSQPRELDMDIGYEDNRMPQTFEGIEQRFLDDIMKLSKEQNDAEDAENARHRERLNAINTQYQEQLAALRARYASWRDEILKRESHARKKQYEQAAMDQYSDSRMDPGEPYGYNAVAAPAGEPDQAYNADYHDSHRGRGRGRGRAIDREFDPKVQYPGGRACETGSRYY